MATLVDDFTGCLPAPAPSSEAARKGQHDESTHRWNVDAVPGGAPQERVIEDAVIEGRAAGSEHQPQCLARARGTQRNSANDESTRNRLQSQSPEIALNRSESSPMNHRSRESSQPRIIAAENHRSREASQPGIIAAEARHCALHFWPAWPRCPAEGGHA